MIIRIHYPLTINKVGLNLVTFSFDGGLIKVNKMLGRMTSTRPVTFHSTYVAFYLINPFVMWPNCLSR